MKLKFYQIDAFTTKVFHGNPAAICFLDEWLDDTLMQNIAMENNLSETAFFVKHDDGFYIRWFTPNKEVNLCGHATLAAAFVLFNLLDFDKENITFYSKSGPLYVSKKEDEIEMDFPSEPLTPCETPQAILDAFSLKPLAVLKNVDYIVIFEENTNLETLSINLESLKSLDLRGVCISTKNDSYDFTSRFFAPNYGINEDPVTGSAHTQLTPYWAKKLNKNILHTKQVSPRGGELRCELKGERVLISGKAVCYMEATVEIGD